MAYDALLPFRPPNVVQQFDIREGVLLLNGRNFFQAALSLPGCLVWAPAVNDGAAMVGVIRAAAHRRVFVGLTMQPTSADRQKLKQKYSPRDYFRLVMESVGQVPNAPPFFLHVQEPPIQASLRIDFEAVRDHIAGCIEAGFTSVGLDLSRCSASQVSSAVVELLQPVLDFDLGVVVRLPKNIQPEHLEAMNRYRKESTIVMAPGPDELGAVAIERAVQWRHMIGFGAVGWRDTKHIGSESLRQTPVKVLIGGDRFHDPARMEMVGSDPEKKEAFVYIESLVWLDRLKQKMTAQRLLEYFSP